MLISQKQGDAREAEFNNGVHRALKHKSERKNENAEQMFCICCPSSSLTKSLSKQTGKDSYFIYYAVAYHKIILFRGNVRGTNCCFPASAPRQGDDPHRMDLMSLHFHLVFNFQPFIDLLLLAITTGYVIATRAVV